MDGFLEQEVELENQIETYRAQLNLIKGNSSENGDTDQIIADLTQLIALTEENLMELKKQKLLMMLHVPDTGHEMQPLAIDPSTEEGEGKVEEEDEEELRDDLVGMKCSAPLKESWGGESHHNAVILCREEVEPPSGDDDFEVHVLFTQPLYNAMKPCSFYLEGSCKFSQEECKFSHGHVVQFSRLRPFQEADHSVAHVGGKCLAKHEDGLWYQGIISSLGEEYVVYFPSLSLTAQVREEGVLPLESSDESSNGESFGEEEGEEVVEWRPSGLQCALGEWERHTTGIGSKLLSKMGYVVGKGLGKEGQGRVEPVEIIILPAGKSLDVCAELREAKKVRMVDGVEVVKRRKKKRRKKCGKASSTQDKTGDMFQFLNTKVFSRGTSESGRFQLEKEEKAPPSGNAGNLNVQLFKVQEEIKAMNKRKQSLRESLQRHQKRKDRQLERQAREKLAAAESQLQHLHRQEKSIEKNISTKSERKKLSVF